MHFSESYLKNVRTATVQFKYAFSAFFLCTRKKLFFVTPYPRGLNVS